MVPEIPVTPTTFGLTEANNSPMLLADPTDDRFVAAAYRLDAPAFSCGLQVSGNKGLGFVGVNPVPKLPDGAERCYAPEIAFDREGVLYYLFIGLEGRGNEPMGVFLTTSADHGKSFSTPWRVLGPQNYMVRLAIDGTAGSSAPAGPGRLHLAWVHVTTTPGLGGLPPPPNPILAAHSDDRGRTFSEPVQVNDGSRARVVGPALSVGPDGHVHVAYYDLQDDTRDYLGLTGPVWDGPWSLVVATSTDGGRTFGPGALVTDKIEPPGRVMLIYTMAPPPFVATAAGHVYLAWPDAREGDSDVFFARSVDDGRSWAPPLRANDDHPGHPADQLLPRLGVAPGGRIDLAFLDRRNDPENRLNDVYFTYSLDGGETFAPNMRVTAEGSDSGIGQRYELPSAEGLVEIGSRIAVMSRAGDALLAWPDMRNSTFGFNQQDVFAAQVRFPSDSGRDRGGRGGGPGAGVVVGTAAGLVFAVLVVVIYRRKAKGRTVA